MHYAKMYETPIVIGVETMHFLDALQISFATKSEKLINRMLNQIIRHYAKNRYFDGVAIQSRT